MDKVLKIKSRNTRRIDSVFQNDSKKFNRVIAGIRSDHGTEFENSKIDQFCMKNGTSHNFSAPRTPLQNGVVERKNRTFVNIARTMIIESNLPQSFWAEAVNTACHVNNRCLIRCLLNKTP